LILELIVLESCELLVVCSVSTKGQVSLVIGKQRQTKNLQKLRWVEEEAGAVVVRDTNGKGDK